MHNVSKKKLFPSNYHYRAKLTQDVLTGMKELVYDLKKETSLNKKVVLDIGCNDGSLLNIFKKKGCITLGVEPTNASIDAKNYGHTIYRSYFNKKIVKKIKKKFKKIDIITFTNVFAHIENFKELVKNLKLLMGNNTILVIENHYLGAVLNKFQFDTFYHEHPRTYSLNSFLKISELLNVKLIKYSFPKRYSGNIRVYFNNDENKVLKKTDQILIKEKKFEKKFNLMQKKILTWKKNKKKFFKDLLNKYGPLPAKAFPGRAAIILNYLKLNEKNIKCVYEKDNSPKINHYVPGTRIPIIKEKEILKETPTVPIINLAWHISKEIKLYLSKLKLKNKVIDIISPKDF